MNILDWILLGGIGVAVFVAVRCICKKRKNGDCIGCSGSCASCMRQKNTKK
ncbi:MAG TPA: FeoB-associated Cys-rich membrane protein [Lachnospiraceae bacterium]|nr:FeoB-associated Cys-rich membrane protein [Lachnospiraceae bacterium]